MSRQTGDRTCRIVSGRPMPAVLAAILLIACIILPATAVPAYQTAAPAPDITLAVKNITAQTTLMVPTKAVTQTMPASALVPVRAANTRTVSPTVTAAGEPGETPRSPVVVTPFPAGGTGNTDHGAAGEAAEESREGNGASEPFTGEDPAGWDLRGMEGAGSWISRTLTPLVTEDPRIFDGGLFSTGEEKQQVLFALREEDPSVQDIRGGDNAVIIEYGKQGKLLGLVPVPYTETVTIGPGGEYQATISWWAIFTEHEPPGGMTLEETLMKRVQVVQVLSNVGKTRNDSASDVVRNAK